MKVICDVDEIELQNDEGVDVPSVCITCSRCDHRVEVFGTSDRSIRRGLATLREECPNDEENYYEEES